MTNIPTQITCVTSGLLALDVVCLGSKFAPEQPSFSHTGGTCGNVTALVAAAGHHAIPVGRLGKDQASVVIRAELSSLGVDLSYVSTDAHDVAPIIFHYIKNDGLGGHRFDLRHPVSRKHLPAYRAITKTAVEGYVHKIPRADIFYGDRITPGTLALAKALKEKGASIFFEPQRASQDNLRSIAPFVDILKFSEGRIASLGDVDFGKRSVVIIETAGAAGVRFQCAKGKIGKKWSSIPALKGVHPVDAAGAGDWMTASLICNALPALVSRDVDRIAKELAYARAWSVIAVLFPGARGAMRHLSMEMVRTFSNSFSGTKPFQDALSAINFPIETTSSTSLQKILASLKL